MEHDNLGMPKQKMEVGGTVKQKEAIKIELKGELQKNEPIQSNIPNEYNSFRHKSTALANERNESCLFLESLELFLPRTPREVLEYLQQYLKINYLQYMKFSTQKRWDVLKVLKIFNVILASEKEKIKQSIKPFPERNVIGFKYNLHQKQIPFQSYHEVKFNRFLDEYLKDRENGQIRPQQFILRKAYIQLLCQKFKNFGGRHISFEQLWSFLVGKFQSHRFTFINLISQETLLKIFHNLKYPTLHNSFNTFFQWNHQFYYLKAFEPKDKTMKMVHNGIQISMTSENIYESIQQIYSTEKIKLGAFFSIYFFNFKVVNIDQLHISKLILGEEPGVYFPATQYQITNDTLKSNNDRNIYFKKSNVTSIKKRIK